MFEWKDEAEARRQIREQVKKFYHQFKAPKEYREGE